jgi:hypothetical protein
MPVEHLTDEQVAAYGRFAGPPTRAQVERSFFLNDADRELIEQRSYGRDFPYGVEGGLLGTGAFLLGFLLTVAWVRLRRGSVRLYPSLAQPPTV